MHFTICLLNFSIIHFLVDARANSCRLTYESLADGNITRKLNIFAGRLTASHCIAHCGCLSRAYAGLDSHGHCFCGSELGTTCTTEPECMRVSDPVFSSIFAMELLSSKCTSFKRFFACSLCIQANL